MPKDEAELARGKPMAHWLYTLHATRGFMRDLRHSLFTFRDPMRHWLFTSLPGFGDLFAFAVLRGRFRIAVEEERECAVGKDESAGMS